MNDTPPPTLTLSRRALLGAGAALSGAVATAACTRLTAAPPPAARSAAQSLAAFGNVAPPPPLEVIALNRMAYGPRPGDVARVRAMGFAAYVEEQLAPDDDDDAVLHAHLKAARMPIEHEGNADYPAVDEMRPLRALQQPLAELWRLVDWEHAPEAPYAEIERPTAEVIMATFLRAIYSKWQLREVLVEFWHNHFHVNVFSDDERILATFPLYDRDVISAHALGNFRAFLAAVAQSTAMLYYLDNFSSKASPANENYARELFELHTLGAAHYYNHQYQHWRDVPGATDGRAEGYIDEDVYEAARAFTGWTVADGRELDDGDVLPSTGAFHYYAGWHDPYQKRVLGAEFAPNQPALADGQQVLDILAYHPATARHICTKLCRRLVADDPPATLVERAVATWMETQTAPDQIAQTVRAIVLSPEFAATWGQKVKRPYEVLLALLRATDATVQPGYDLHEVLSLYGYRMFAWQAPDGHPDTASYWLSTNAMLGRWNIPVVVLFNWLGEAQVDLLAQQPADVRTPRQVVRYWGERLLGYPVDATTSEQVTGLLGTHLAADEPLSGLEDAEHQQYVVAYLVAMLAMTPHFQWR